MNENNVYSNITIQYSPWPMLRIKEEERPAAPLLSFVTLFCNGSPITPNISVIFFLVGELPVSQVLINTGIELGSQFTQVK